MQEPPSDSLATRGKPERQHSFPVIAGLLIAVLFLLWLLLRWASRTSLGTGDFVGYWTAAYIFRLNQNPYDPTLVRQIQDTLIGLNLQATIMSWNPPTLLVFLAPLAYLPFESARAVWMVINFVLVFITGVVLIQIYDLRGLRIVFVFLIFAVTFPQVLTVIAMGQVVFLVLIGLVISMALVKREHYFWAGAALLLTTVKPHMVILAVPYLMFTMAFRRKWAGWVGLLSSGAACIAVLFLIHPTWLQDYSGLTQIAPVSWATPTIGGLLSDLGITPMARYAIVVLIPIAAILAHPRFAMPIETTVAWLTLVTVPFTFFGWSYDQSLLLIPAAQVFAWLSQIDNVWIRLGTAGGVISVSVAIVMQRLQNLREITFVWVGIAWLMLSAAVWVAHRKSPSHLALTRTQPAFQE